MIWSQCVIRDQAVLRIVCLLIHNCLASQLLYLGSVQLGYPNLLLRLFGGGEGRASFPSLPSLSQEEPGSQCQRTNNQQADRRSYACPGTC